MSNKDNSNSLPDAVLFSAGDAFLPNPVASEEIPLHASISSNHPIPDVAVSSSSTSDNLTAFPYNNESMCNFSIRKDGVKVLDEKGTIVEERNEVVEHRFVPIRAYNSGEVSIHHIISHVRFSHGNDEMALWKEVCSGCNQDPCLLYDHASRSKKLVFFSTKKEKNNHQDGFYLYRKMTKIILENLSAGDRCELPNCIVECIRTAFPNKNNEPYVGFSDP